MRELHKCPICNGKGIVTGGFYNPSDFSITGTAQETCRSCNGEGYIIIDCYETKIHFPASEIYYEPTTIV